MLVIHALADGHLHCVHLLAAMDILFARHSCTSFCANICFKFSGVYISEWNYWIIMPTHAETAKLFTGYTIYILSAIYKGSICYVATTSVITA